MPLVQEPIELRAAPLGTEVDVCAECREDVADDADAQSIGVPSFEQANSRPMHSCALRDICLALPQSVPDGPRNAAELHIVHARILAPIAYCAITPRFAADCGDRDGRTGRSRRCI
jgi:hypothetical protein